jgi:hypothetical protein
VLKEFFIIQSILIGLLSGAACFDTWQMGASLFIGGALMMLNFALLAWTWQMIGRKKLVALSLLIIVSKYTILAVVLYSILSLPWVQPLGFLVGISIFVFAAVLLGLYQRSSFKAQAQE